MWQDAFTCVLSRGCPAAGVTKEVTTGCELVGAVVRFILFYAASGVVREVKGFVPTGVGVVSEPPTCMPEGEEPSVDPVLLVCGHAGLHFFADVSSPGARDGLESVRPLTGHTAAVETLALELENPPSFLDPAQASSGKFARLSALELLHFEAVGTPRVVFDDPASEQLLRALGGQLPKTLKSAYAEGVRRGHRVRSDAIAYGGDLLLYPGPASDGSRGGAGVRNHASHIVWCFPGPPSELQRGRIARLARSVKKKAVAAFFEGSLLGNGVPAAFVFEEVVAASR